MTSAQLTPAIILPLVLWRVYVRVRRNVGRQPLQVKRLKMRIILFAVACAVIAAMAAGSMPALAAFLGGVAGSLVLAWFGVRLTLFERTTEGDFYTPNTLIGVALSLVLVGRLMYRFLVLYGLMKAGDMPRTPASFQSPLTLAILGLTCGYYVAYYAGVLRRARHLDAAPTAV